MRISYSKTFNLGNYEAEKISLDMEEVSQVDIEKSFKFLVDKVHELQKLTPKGEPKRKTSN